MSGQCGKSSFSFSKEAGRNISTVGICNPGRSYPQGSDHSGNRSGGSHSSGGAQSTYVPPPKNVVVIIDGKYYTGASLSAGPVQKKYNIMGKEIVFSVCPNAGYAPTFTTEAELLKGILIGAITDTSPPAPFEYKSCAHDDIHMATLKGLVNRIYRDFWDMSKTNGPITNMLDAIQLKDLSEKIIDYNNYLLKTTYGQ